MKKIIRYYNYREFRGQMKTFKNIIPISLIITIFFLFKITNAKFLDYYYSLYNHYNQISLTIKGTGEASIINSNYISFVSQVYINNALQNKTKTTLFIAL